MTKSLTHILCAFQVLILYSYQPCLAKSPDAKLKLQSVLEYQGKDVRLSQVDPRKVENAQLVVIKSFDRLIIDSNFPNIPQSARQPSVLIIAPTVVVEGQRAFELQGKNGSSSTGVTFGPGIAGEPGGTAGSIILAYRRREVHNRGTLTFYVDGGSGGKGQVGADGANGANGDFKVINEEKHCTAYADGWVKVHITPNYCNSKGDDRGRCQVSIGGAQVDVIGTEGKRGGKGNDGGSGGNQGHGGFAIVADIGLRLNKTTTGREGKKGEDGASGKPGKGGRQGATNSLLIKIITGNRGKRCKIVRSKFVRSNVTAPDGNYGYAGGNCCGNAAKDMFSQESFRPYILKYVNECRYEAYQRNDYVLLGFCNDVRKHFRL